MDINEFEIRYRSIVGLSRKFNLERTQEEILSLCAISQQGMMTKKINETNPNELKSLTIETYSEYKRSFIATHAHQSTKLGSSLLVEYIERMEYELKVIKEMGFNSYLLVVADFINRAKFHQIPVGPGRGSAAGSLIAWLIGITDVDPLVFGLLFERFLNPVRVSMPDIDTDFDDEQRERVYEYVRNHYGHEMVAKIGTFMNMSAKAAFKDVARVMGMPFELSNKISGLFTVLNDDKTINFRRCWSEVGELSSMIEQDDTIKQLVDITDSLIGTYRQTGVHACGVIIGPDNLTHYLPQQLPPNTPYSPHERNITQYDYNAAKIEDTIGVIKMDFLGLGNLSIIKNTIKIIAKRHEFMHKELPKLFVRYMESSVFEPPIDDLYVYETIFQKGNTTGVFQFESDGMKRFLMLLKPDTFDDIVSMSALYRPGPIEFIPSFIHRKHGEEAISYIYPELYQTISHQYSTQIADDEKRKLEEDLKPILESTYGVAVFQEQLMFMSQAVAGFSFAQADELRRGIGKKLVAVVQKMKQEFITKAQEFRSYKKETATWVFEKMIEPAALYSFNKSHSVAYSLVAFQTAYLKTYYPIEFYAALLRANENNVDELSKFINEVKFQGYKILGPDINHSYNHVSAIDDYVRLGFLSIKGVGSEVGETIQSIRKNTGEFRDLGDFLMRCQSVINKKSLEGLIKAGALDSLCDRGALLENSDYLLERSKSSHQIADGGLFGGSFSQATLDLKVKRPLNKMSILKLEYEVFKTFISFHPLDGLYPRIKARGHSMISQFKYRNYEKEQRDYGSFSIVALVTKITRARKKGYFIKVEDSSDSIEFFVKEPLDIKEFDLLLIYGYRGKSSPRWKKLINIDLDILIKVAQDAGKYDPQETVFEVKKRRLGLLTYAPHILPSSSTADENEEVNLEVDAAHLIDQSITSPYQEELSEITNNQIDNTSQDSSSDQGSHNLEDPSQDDHTSQDHQHNHSVAHEETVSQKIKFDLPHDIQSIKQLQAIIVKYPGNHEVGIGSMSVRLNNEGIDMLRGMITR